MGHWVIHLDNSSAKKGFIDRLLLGKAPLELNLNPGQKGLLFSQLTLDRLMEEEDKRDHRILGPDQQAIETMSNGEQKKALLFYLLEQQPDFIILDNPFDNLDASFKEQLKTILKKHANDITLIQLASRRTDALAFIQHHGVIEGAFFKEISLSENESDDVEPYPIDIPPPIEKTSSTENPLIEFKNVTVSYGAKSVLKNIQWTVNKGDFWQLTGANGSGKSTILSMITGDNPKAFGQEIYLFGQKKGSGESVWEIKQKIGYYSPAMTHKFKGRHSVEHMLISGLTDSVGLYTLPSEGQKRIIKQWLVLLDLHPLKDTYFNQLSIGNQRLVMTARAMVKHPSVLILDEPTADMDDASAKLLVILVNKIAKQTDTAIIFVSHRKEPGLLAQRVYTLQKTPTGSIGVSAGT